MGIFSSERLDERRIGKIKIRSLKENKDRTIVIHYSCESFFNTHGRTPRITSIVIKNRNNGSSIAYSLHLTAQIKGIDLKTASIKELDAIERIMLQEFYAYQKKHLTYNWVHWNMRNAVFGFEAIANRFRILGGNPKRIEDHFKFDLPDILRLLYTGRFEEHENPTKGQMLNLAIRNNITRKDALTGAEEGTAFDIKDFLQLHMSTMRKVEIIDRIISLEERKNLKTASSTVNTYGLTPEGIIEIVRNNWLLFAIWSVLMAVIGMALEQPIQDWIASTF